MGQICEGRVAIVTGGGRGLGRSHAHALAAGGASVVVNDIGAALDGSPSERGGRAIAEDVAAEIRKAGGRAIANTDDVTSWDGAGRLIDSAIAEFGRLDALVCNAGNLLDRELADMSQHEWEVVLSVHLTGHAAALHHAGRHWRAFAEKTSEPSAGRAVLTTSTAGVWGDAGRANYNSAKAGIVLLGRTAALEFAKYGACVNVIAPYARTRMTISLDPGLADTPADDRYDPWGPGNISPLVVWLCSEHAAAVTGELFEIHARHLAIIEAPRHGPATETDGVVGPAELGRIVERLLAERRAGPR